MIRSKIASRFERAKTKTFLWGLLALALHLLPGAIGPAHAQGTRKDDIVFNSRGIPLAGATVRVCAMPASGQPCTPLALIYSDAALSQALANPTTTDGLGNYFFYAAPGRYEIEISGPAITTKQIPNVILPSDPSSPTFTGGITAFSLNLSGNLTVNGNTTVVGNLASGTLNLSNQVTPPGGAGSGTVNLYAKTADKRLYYKDDTGTEVGPVGNTGSTLVSPVTNPNPVYFDTDLGFKGSNPWADIRRFGKFGTFSSTTANTTSASPTVTVASAQSFQNGEYVTVYNAGAANAISAMGTVTLTPSLNAGGFNTVAANAGAASFSYKVVAADKFGGYTAASAAASTTTGNSLGMQTIGITSMSRSGTTVTVTTSAAHLFVANSEVFIQYFGGNADTSFNGFFIVKTVADSTHFTFTSGLDTASGATTFDTGGTAIGFTCNHLTWSVVTGAWKYYIYGRVSGTWSLMGVTLDTFFDDYGSPMNDNRTFPSFIPATAPATGANDHLTAQITAGGGTTTLTLASNAGATLTGATIVSDDGPALVAACASFGAPCYVPAVGARVSSYTILPTFSKMILAGSITTDDTIEFRGGEIVEGWLGASSAQFAWEGNVASFAGQKAYPQISLDGGPHVFRRVMFNCTASNGCLNVADYSSGNPVTNVTMDGSAMGTGNGTTSDYLGQHAIFQADGFSFRFDKMLFTTGSPGTNAQTSVGFSPIPTIIFKNFKGQAGAPTGNFAVTRSWFVARASFDQDYVAGSGGINWWIVRDVQTQNSFLPPFMTTGIGASAISGNFDFEDITPADFPTAVLANLQTQGATQTGLWMKQVSCLQGGNAITTGAAFLQSHFFDACLPGQNFGYFSGPFFSNNSVQVNGTAGAIGYSMLPAAAPVSAVVSSGGSVPVGAHNYAVTWTDVFGKETALGSTISATTTTGNQTVTVTPPSAPAGATGVVYYRDGQKHGPSSNNCGPFSVTATLVDTLGFVACGGSPATAAFSS